MWAILAGVLVGCGEKAPTGETGTGTPTDGTDPTTSTTTEGGYCAVRRAFVRECVVCHDAASPDGDLDLQTDAWSALVNVASPDLGAVRVIPGDPAGSLLVRKLSGTQAADEGDPMPPPRGADAALVDLVTAWIADGATEACGTPGTTTEPGPYHPRGWDAPEVHGLATKLQTEADCRSCHGNTLDGGTSGVACDDCHAPRWETDCTFCHGGVLSESGAPPEDIDDNDDPDTISFPPHETHLSARITAQWDCDQCHTKPTDALSPGHLFDDPTAGVAEVVIDRGGTWTAGSCSDVVCHGDGRSVGDIQVTAGSRSCTDCHGGVGSAFRLSGRHADHVGEGLACAECHPDAQGSNAIDQPDLHVDTVVDVALPGTMSWDPTRNRCDGTCHFERHGGETW